MPSFRCEHCRQKIAARDTYAGRRVRCPRCKQAVRVPALEAPPVAPLAGPAAANVKVDVQVNAPVPVPEPAPVFTQPPPRDFSSIFSAPLDALFEGGPHDYAPEELTQVLRPVHPPVEPSSGEEAMEFPFSEIGDIESPPKPPPVAVEPAEVIDAPTPMRSGLNSVNEVADLLRGLDNPAQRARLAATSAAADGEVRRQIVADSRPVRVLGWMSLCVGLASVALSCHPAWVRFAVPAGAAGILLAITGLVLAVGRRAGIGLPAGGAVVSTAGVGAALLWGIGLLPWGAWAQAHVGLNTPPVILAATTQPSGKAPSADYVLASSPLIVNHLQVRVVSALVLRPAVYAGDLASLHTADVPRLQIALELKNLSGARSPYLPWRRNDEGNGLVQLIGPDGQALRLDELEQTDPAKPVVLAAAALPEPVYVETNRPVTDVLLFDAPATIRGDFLLDLPGKNIGQPRITLHIRIPGSMIRVQRK